MFLWRISNHSLLDGRGGLIASARWHNQGRPIVYLAETPPGSLIEVLVHLGLDPGAIPASYHLLKAQAPDNLPVDMIRRIDLPDSWITHLTATRAAGDNWLASGASALLRVPSAIVPETFNVLLNPNHADARRVQVLWHEKYPWDRRLL